MNNLLLQMDYNCLGYLIEHGGEAPAIAIPAKLFSGSIPDGHPDLVDLGMIENDGDIVRVTQAARQIMRRAAA